MQNDLEFFSCSTLCTLLVCVKHSFNFILIFLQSNIKYFSNNQRLGSTLDDLDSRLSFLCQDCADVILPCKIWRGCQIHIPRSIRLFIRSFICSSVHPPVCPSVHLFIHPFVHSFITAINVVPYNLDCNLY